MLAYTFYESDNRVRRYAETLVKRGDQVDAFVLRQKGQSSFEVIEGVHVYRIQERLRDEDGALSYLRKLLVFLVRSAWFLTRSHLRKPYDLIHVHSMPDFLVLATLLPRLFGGKVILDIHDVLPELYASKFKLSQHSVMFRLLVWEERLSIKYSDHVIIANHIWHERVARRSGCAYKCSTILNYPDLSIFYSRPRTSESDREFVMCYPGTLSWHQGVDLVLCAMAKLRDELPNLGFLIIGAGAEEQRLISMAKQYGIEDRVTMKGRLPIEMVAETMANIDLGVEPKRNDPFSGDALSTKIPEFMAMNVPVLASTTRVHQFYFKNDVVEFFESDNSEDLAAKILALVRSPARRAAVRERANTFILKNNWGARKEEYLGLVDSLLETGREAHERATP